MAKRSMGEAMTTQSPDTVAEGETESDRWDLISEHRERLHRLAASRLGGSPDAEDCVHEAMIRAATFHNLDTNRLGAFLTTVTLRLCIDHQRSALRQQRFLAKYFVPDNGDIGEEVCERAAASWLMARTDDLATRERDVILARMNGMSTADVAQNFEITYKSAESAYARARKRMRALYEEEVLQR